MNSSRIAVVAVVLALVVAPLAAAPGAATPPDPPASYYGQVTVNGDAAPAGVTVAAVVNGSVTDTLTTDADGSFGGSNAFAEKLVVSGSDGENVTFRVGDRAVETVPWESGATENVTLAVTDDTPPEAVVEAPDRVPAGTTVQFDAGASSDDVAVESYDWSLPGGESAAGPTATATLTEPGQRTVSVTVTDAGGNTATATASVVVTGPSDGGGGDGQPGNGGQPADSGSEDATGGDTDAPADDGTGTDQQVAVGADSVAVTLTDLPTNETATVDLPATASTSAAGVSVDALDVATTRSANVSLDVSVRADQPANASSPGAGTVAYVRVEESVSEETLAGVDFSFTVTAGRLDERGVAAEDVSLYRLHDGEWAELETRVVGGTDTGYQFVAESPGLSVFAVRAAAPSVSVTDASLGASETTVGEAVELSATLTNDGDANGTATVPFVVDGEQVAERTVTVQANGERTVTAAYEPAETGEVEVTAGNVTAGTLAVSEQPPTTTTGDETTTAAGDGDATTTPPPTSEPQGFSPLTVGALGAVLAAILGLFLLARRRA